MRAAVRWIAADLRARRGQAAAAVVVVAGVVLALLLSAALLEGATNPWRALFAQSRGAGVWLRLGPGTPAQSLARLPGVTGVAGPYRTASATAVVAGRTAPVQLWGMSPTPPAIARPLVRHGHWLRRADPSGVVLEASFAQALRVSLGSRLVIEGLDGSSVRVHVTGLAYTSDQGFYPDQAPGLGWALPVLINRVEPLARHTGQVAGLRLASLSAAGFVVQEAVSQLGSEAVLSVSTWRDVARSMARQDPLLGLLLALFGLVALGAAALAIGNAAGGRVLTQRQDLAMLKTLGLTPRQVVGMLLAEHAALGLAGIGAGVIVARTLTGSLLRHLPPGLVTAVAPPPAGWVLIVAAGTELALLLATVLPGWQAGRVWPVAAIRPAAPVSRLSRLSRVALLTRLPPAMVLGARAAFTRRLPALLTIGALALPMALITIGLGFWATLDSIRRHPEKIGLAAPLSVRPGELSAAQARALLAADPDVRGVYRSVTVGALLPGETSAITTQGVGSSAHPYPFHVAQGRLYRAPGEAVASQGLLTAAHLRVGEYIRMPVGGVPVIFHLVGRIIEPEGNGQVLAYGIDTLTQAGAVPPPEFYRLVLRPGVSPAVAAAHLLRRSHGRLDVTQAANPAANLGIVGVMLASLFVVLALIALTSLLTASAVGLRDHLPDLGALRAMGLTPWQVAGSLVTRMSVLALVATATGTGAGLLLCTRLINLAGQAYGIGAGLGTPPPAVPTLAAAAAAVVTAAVVAAVTGYRAVRTPVAVALRPLTG